MNSQRSHLHNNIQRNNSKQKTIKSIRIIERSPSLTQRQILNCQTQQEFSFKKKKKKINADSQTEELAINQILQNQQNQIEKLKRMLKAMKQKQKQQNKELEHISAEAQVTQKQRQKNMQLKNQLHQLKDLMKELLLQKENMRMLTFYQEQY